MDMGAFMTFFTKTDVPFTLLFVALFFYVIKSNTSRETRLNKIIEAKLDSMQDDMRVLMNIWKILLEKELKSQEAKNNEPK